MLWRSALLAMLLVVAVLLSLGVVSGTGQSDRLSDSAGDPGAAISDGFKVAPGTRLVSPAMPWFPATQADEGSQRRAWMALLDVEVDSKSALNAYVVQSRDAGFGQQDRASCSRITGLGGVRCGASLVRNESGVGQVVIVDVIVCKRCPVPLSAARLRMIEDPALLRALDPDEYPLAAPAPGSAPTAELSAPERAEAARNVRRSNDRGRVKPPEGGVVVKGSELVAPVVGFGGCQGDWNAVYRVSGKPTAVLESYLESLDAIYGDATTRVRSKGEGARSVRSNYDGGPGTVDVTLLEEARGQSAYLWAENCSD